MICEQARKVDIRRGRGGWPEYRLPDGSLVAVVSTPCHLGGERLWWLCPRCGRRCAILYPRVCRICAKGRYASELMSPMYRALTKERRLRRRLGQTNGWLGCAFPPKPKGMHWTTYHRLVAKGEEIEAEITRLTIERFGTEF